ncbi:MAG: HD family hydrolase [Candidatus Methanomethylicia archaeon]|nr:HD family hydrolase [Candidatus Methanomethylicia archaeon]
MEFMGGLFEALERLGRIKRTGWIIAKIPNDISESIAEHTLKTVFIAMMINRELNIGNEDKLIKMALIHDLPEALTSDIPKPIKEKLGEEVVSKVMLESFKNLIDYDELIALYIEYIRGESVEARIVDLADSIATYIQALNYRNQYCLKTPHLKSIIEHVENRTTKKTKELGLELDSIMKKLIGMKY